MLAISNLKVLSSTVLHNNAVLSLFVLCMCRFKVEKDENLQDLDETHADVDLTDGETEVAPDIAIASTLDLFCTGFWQVTSGL